MCLCLSGKLELTKLFSTPTALVNRKCCPNTQNTLFEQHPVRMARALRGLQHAVCSGCWKNMLWVFQQHVLCVWPTCSMDAFNSLILGAE